MSGLANYASGSTAIANELRAEVSAEAVKQLHDLLLGKPISYWFRWRVDNHELVCDYVSSPPSARKKLKKFAKDKLLLSMAGINLCQEASALLREITCPPLQAGGSYREMAALAGDAYCRILAAETPCWPFANMASPFIDDNENRNESL